MEEDRIYEKWTRHRKEVPVPGDFSQQVMNELRAAESQARTGAVPEYLAELPIFTSRLIRFALALGMAALGVFRVSYVTVTLLVP